MHIMCCLQEDAYDAVKTHMFDLLAAVAAECQPAQLDMLFAKLERRQARSVQDTERLLALLESLAESDTDVSVCCCVSGCLRAAHSAIGPNALLCLVAVMCLSACSCWG